MSYEGSEEYLCTKGHRWSGPCLYGMEPQPACPYCKSPIAWAHAIDDTNYDNVGFIPDHVWDEAHLLTPEKVETCNLGHKHIVEEATYRAPTDAELRAMEHYLAHDGSYQPCQNLGRPQGRSTP